MVALISFRGHKTRETRQEIELNEFVVLTHGGGNKYLLHASLPRDQLNEDEQLTESHSKWPISPFCWQKSC